jgi:sugar lactone lactonase YvrE
LNLAEAPQIAELAGGFAFLEAPRWHRGRLWVSDFYRRGVFSIAMDGGVHKVVDVPGQPSGLGWLPNGDLLIASMTDRRILRFDGLRLVEHADLSGMAEWHLNDMVMDGQGRAYVGNLGADQLKDGPIATASLIRVDPHSSSRVVAGNLLGPNGSAITPDGRTLLIAESIGGRISSFDISADGSLSNPRCWFSGGNPPLKSRTYREALANGELLWVPDGMALDADGGIWGANPMGRTFSRILAGKIVATIDLSAMNLMAIACALGGGDGRTLFLIAAPTFWENECVADPQAQVLTVRVQSPHAGWP